MRITWVTREGGEISIQVEGRVWLKWEPADMFGDSENMDMILEWKVEICLNR